MNTTTAAAIVGGGLSFMAEQMIEFVVESDCLVEGEPFLRGETKTVPKAIYTQLVGAGRVAKDEAATSAAKKDAVARIDRERAEAEDAEDAQGKRGRPKKFEPPPAGSPAP